MPMLTEAEVLKAFEEYGVPPNVVAHSRAVRDVALDLCDRIQLANPGLKINRRVVNLGALLHDIGRAKSHGIDHGIVGAKLVRALKTDDPELEKLAKICERHIGAGIDAETARKLGLPLGDSILRQYG